MRPSRRSSLPLLLFLVALALVMGIYLGGHPSTLPDPVRDVLVQDGDGEVYDEAIDTLERDYYRKVDRKDLLNQSLDHAVRSLDDRFSNYFAPRDYTDFQQATEGRFEGVGMSVDPVDDGLRIITVYDGSPAKDGGLKPGDVITEVNGHSIAGQDSTEATTRIKGPAGTSVKLTVRTGKDARGRSRSSAPRSRSRSCGPRCSVPPTAPRSPTCTSPASPRARTTRSARRSASS